MNPTWIIGFQAESTIISENALYYQTELSDNFREFLREHNGMVEAVPSRSFAESGTTIETVIVKLIREV